MKKYLIYAIILGCLGQSLIYSASASFGTGNTANKLEQLGE